MQALVELHPRPTLDHINEVETDLLNHLRCRVTRLNLEWTDDGIILRGKALTFYGKQLALHAAQRLTPWPVLANRIEVG